MVISMYRAVDVEIFPDLTDPETGGDAFRAEAPPSSMDQAGSVEDVMAFRGPDLAMATPLFGYLNLDQRGGAGPNGKPSKTLDEAATQLTRTGSTWSAAGQPVTVTYAFRATFADTIPNSDSDAGGFSRFNADQIRQTELALQAWSDVSGIRFTRVGSGVEGDGAYSDSATMLFGNYSTGEAGASAFAFRPGFFSENSGDVWVNITQSNNSNPTIFSFGFQALVHEIGHAIGLSHPSDYNAEENQEVNYISDASYFEDSQQYTIMSYFFETQTGGYFGPRYPAAPLMDDIAAIQKLYGPNMTTRTGDTIYGFNSNADRPWFQATTSNSVMIWAVWDAGGTDTFNFSGYSNSQKVDLRQGSFSDVGGLVGNVSIARGVDIENAIGGSGNDTLFGNTLNNRLEGGAGNDVFWGGGGGADTLIGASGNDVYYIDAPSTLLVENASEGWDAVVVRFGSSVGAWTLSSSIEAASIQVASGGYLIGNTLDNDLEGGSGNDTLEGGAGADTLDGATGVDRLVGGSGNDYYYINSTSDTVIEIEFGGYDTVRTDFNDVGYVYYISANIEFIDNYSNVSGKIFGNSNDNYIYGYSANDTMFGLEGNDTLRGYSGDDYVEGGDGNDRLEEPLNLQGGNDTYLAGAGNDTIQDSNGSNFLRGEAGDDLMSGGSGFDDMHGNMGNDSLRGNDGDDWVVGGKDNDLLFGDAGFDVVYGNMGADTVDGGAGNDWVRGGQGDDTVMGGAGDDWLWGDKGNDTLSGGTGADLFYSLAGAGIDRITDFNFAEGDRLKLEGNPARTITQSGADVIVDMGNGDQVILVGVTLSSLGAGWLI